jgi:hypothetical protein
MTACACGNDSMKKVDTAFMVPDKLYQCECGQYFWKEIPSVNDYTPISDDEAAEKKAA